MAFNSFTDRPLEQLDAELKKLGLPNVASLIGRKFCFSSNDNEYFNASIMVGTVAAVTFEDEVVHVIPLVPPDPMYQLVSFRWSAGEAQCCAEYFGATNLPPDDAQEGGPGYGYLEGIFTLVE